MKTTTYFSLCLQFFNLGLRWFKYDYSIMDYRGSPVSMVSISAVSSILQIANHIKYCEFLDRVQFSSHYLNIFPRTSDETQQVALTICIRYFLPYKKFIFIILNWPILQVVNQSPISAIPLIVRNLMEQKTILTGAPLCINFFHLLFVSNYFFKCANPIKNIFDQTKVLSKTLY